MKGLKTGLALAPQSLETCAQVSVSLVFGGIDFKLHVFGQTLLGIFPPASHSSLVSTCLFMVPTVLLKSQKNHKHMKTSVQCEPMVHDLQN